MGLTGVLIAVIIALALVVAHYRRTSAAGPSAAGSWGAVRESWAQLRGETINMVVAGDAGAAAAEWVAERAPHGKGGAMVVDDADVVCEKACDGWGGSPSVSVFCDCGAGRAVDF